MLSEELGSRRGGRDVAALNEQAEVIAVLVTNADTTSSKSQTHLEGVAIWPLDDFRSWANDVLKTVRGLRTKLTGQGDLAWRAEAMTALEEVHATPSTLRSLLKTMMVES